MKDLICKFTQLESIVSVAAGEKWLQRNKHNLFVMVVASQAVVKPVSSHMILEWCLHHQFPNPLRLLVEMTS